MRRFAVVVTLVLAGCGDDGGSTPDGGTVIGGKFTSTYLSLPMMGNGTLAMFGYGGPLVSVDGDRVIASGLVQFDVSISQRMDVRTLTITDGGTAKLVEKYTYANTVEVRPSSITSDGAGGAYLGATRLQTAQTYISEPVITHFDGNGQVLWSKKYSVTGGYWNLPQLGGSFGVSTYPDVTLSTPFASKLAVLAGNAAMVIDTDGAVQWVQQFPGQTALSQLLADADGFTVYGNLYDAFIVLRYDWAGALQWYKASSNPIHGDVKLTAPHRRADGNIVLGFDTYNTFNANISGAVVYDASGGVVESYAYQLNASWDITTFNRGLSTPSAIRALSDDLVTVRTTYMEGLNPPYRAVPVGLVFKTGASGDVMTPVFSAREEAEWFRLGDGTVIALGNMDIAYGSLAATCSLDAVTVMMLAKGPSPVAIQPTTAMTVTPTTLTVTVADEPVTVTDAGLLTTNPIDNQSCQ